MDVNIVKFKLGKIKNIYNKQGLNYAFLFVWGKIKKKITNRLFYKSFAKSNTFTEADRKRAEVAIDAFHSKPVFSIICPVYNVDEQWLVKAIESVRKQVYPYWELCIADDASTKPHIKPILEKYAGLDSRIKVTYRSSSGNISAASNSAMELATGTYIALLDNDDEITENALYENAVLINLHPDADVIYSDEDKIDEQNNHSDAWFKPDWSPEYLLSHMYVCHFSVYRKQLVDAVGGFRSAFDGAQDYDLCLRITEQTQAVYHIPKILYHWRTIASSTASNPLAKSYAYEAGRKAVEEHLHRTLGSGTVSFTDYYGVYKVNHVLTAQPLVSIVIPSAGKSATVKGTQIQLLENCLKSITQKSIYKNIELIVVDGNDIDETIQQSCKEMGARFVHCTDPFNFSQRINMGVAESKGEYVLMLNDDTEIITPDWIEQLLGFAQQKDIGAVGAKLITEQHLVQHAGIILVDGAPGHIYYGIPDVGQGYFNALVSYKNYLAVTGACILVSKAKYLEVGLMDESFPVNFNDVDFCLKLHEKGYRNVYSSSVVLYHYESVTRVKGFKAEEMQQFVSKWEDYVPAQTDPYYSPVLVKYPALLK
ncbi:MAG: glycosyltransferase [Bacteroidota bacterium]